MPRDPQPPLSEFAELLDRCGVALCKLAVVAKVSREHEIYAILTDAENLLRRHGFSVTDVWKVT